jgi:O-antigen/teichoic acid export membrane protein
MFFKKALSIFSTQVILLPLAIATGIILSRSMGPEVKGQYDLLTTFTSFLSLLGSLGIAAALIFYLNRTTSTKQELISTAIRLQYGLIALMLIGALLFRNLISAYIMDGKVPVALLIMALFAMPFVASTGIFGNLFIGLNAFGRYNLTTLIYVITQLVLLSILVAVLHFGIPGALISACISAMLVLVLSWIWLAKLGYSPVAQADKSWVKPLMTYGVKGWIGNLVQYFNYRMDVFFVNLFLDPAAVAIYSVAVALSETLWYIPSALSTVLFPRTAGDWDQATRFTPLVIRTGLAVTFGAALILMLIGPFLIRIAYGTAFARAGVPLIGLLPGTVMLGTGKVIASDLAGRGKPHYGTYSAVAALFLTVAFDFLLIPRLDILGAAIASSLSYSASTIVLLILYIRVSGNRLAHLVFIQKSDLVVYVQTLRKTFLPGTSQ